MEKTQAKPLTAAQQRQRDKKRRTWLRTGGAVVLLCVHAGRIRGRVFRGKTDLSAHRCRRGALCGQLHTFPAGAVRLHPAFRPFFPADTPAPSAAWAMPSGRFLALFKKTLFHRKKAAPSAGAGGAFGAEGQISAAGMAGSTVCDPAGKGC